MKPLLSLLLFLSTATAIIAQEQTITYCDVINAFLNDSLAIRHFRLKGIPDECNSQDTLKIIDNYYDYLCDLQLSYDRPIAFDRACKLNLDAMDWSDHQKWKNHLFITRINICGTICHRFSV